MVTACYSKSSGMGSFKAFIVLDDVCSLFKILPEYVNNDRPTRGAVSLALGLLCLSLMYAVPQPTTMRYTIVTKATCFCCCGRDGAHSISTV